MATRKQRARRAKTFRHDYALVDYDEEGNEIEIKAAELRAKKESPEKPKPAQARSGRGAMREPQPPSWERALKRGGLWGGVIIVLSLVLLKGASVPSRVLIGALYAAMFIPFSYWLDGVVYRRWEKKRADGPTSRSGKPR
jgi:hypothetical protein